MQNVNKMEELGRELERERKLLVSVHSHKGLSLSLPTTVKINFDVKKKGVFSLLSKAG